MGLLDRGVEIKTPEQIDLMRRAGLLTGQTLELLRGACRPGITTGELDAIAEDHIRSNGGVPSFQGYGFPPFPATICASVNEEVVHGIPGSRELVEGDVISIDCGAIVEGWHGDAAITVAIGDVPADVAELMRVTEESLWAGIAAARLGGRVTDISHAVESSVRAHGDYGILEDYVGHGIGSQMHMPPNVPNVGRPGRGPKLVPGLALAVEPMVTLGTNETDVLADDWTVVTADGSRAAHFEHTFTLTPNGAWVLTALDGGEERLTALGVPVRWPLRIPRYFPHLDSFGRMDVTPLVWWTTILVTSAILVFDVFVIGRRPHEPSRRETVTALAIYIGLAIFFGLGVWYFAGSQYGGEFFAGWLTEYSLSIDNLFIFIVIMGKLAVPRELQQSALMVGIVLALILRGIFIAVGAAAIAQFSWVFYIFGLFLVLTAVNLSARPATRTAGTTSRGWCASPGVTCPSPRPGTAPSSPSARTAPGCSRRCSSSS